MNVLLRRDERESAIDRAADRVSYLVLAFGVLLLAAYRSIVLHDPTFDLLALVVVAGAAGVLYRIVRGTTTRRWALAMAIPVAIAAAFAIAVVVATR